MRSVPLSRRSLVYHWRTNLAVTLGAAVGTAALTGALFVGDSMRGSLREAAVGRLGRTDYALVAPRFFRTALADDLAHDPDFDALVERVAPVILLQGGVTHADSRTRADKVQLLGVDDRFWTMGSLQAAARFSGRSVILNAPLAEELGARVGDDVLIRTAKPSAVATETLLGRRDDTVSTIRLPVSAILHAEGLGSFSLRPRQSVPKIVYLPLDVLQRALQQPDRVNAILVDAIDGRAATSEPDTGLLHEILQRHVALADLGLTLRIDETRGYISLEGESILLPQAVEKAVGRVGDPSDSLVLTYLANTIAVEGSDPSPNRVVIPYSTVAAIDPESWDGRILTATQWRDPPAFRSGEILLNQWAAEDLQVSLGDRITLTYYAAGPFGRLETRSTTFTLRAIVPLTGIAADPGFIPEYHGITDTQNLADWNPPFPIDLRLIRDKDEAYWDQHRTTPKAFITLADGQRLWAQEGDRFGRLTSIRRMPKVVQVFDWRLRPYERISWDSSAYSKSERTAWVRDHAKHFERQVLREVRLDRMGFRWDFVRQRAAEASQGSTDFGMLFIGFSSFLILSSAMLVALLFRLNLERRSSQIGLLFATGFRARNVTGILLAEGVGLAVVGGVIGVAAASGYAWLMLAGLRSWWSDAVHAPFLRLFVSPASLTVGFAAGVTLSGASVVWSIRGMTRRSPCALLAGAAAEGSASDRRRGIRRASWTGGVAFTLTAVTILASTAVEWIPRSAAFFLAGSAMLVACLSMIARWLRRDSHGVVHRPGLHSLARLAARNASRQTGRSLLTAGLTASAAFVILSLEAFRLDARSETDGLASGTGGFSLYAESAIPLTYDLNTPEGREAMSIEDPALDPANGFAAVPFRLRPGEETSCLNLFSTEKPRVLGVTEALFSPPRFRFAATVADGENDKANPWTLLLHDFPDGAIPAIGDESAVKWILHSDLGKDLLITDERGTQVRLRFVALLKNSVLQNELLISEASFVRLFPSVGGHGFFLIETRADTIAVTEAALEGELERFGFDAAPTARRLGEFLAVQNTYLSTFQTLGGIGLILGTAGLGAVMLRNVWERRGELALMRAVGFSRGRLLILVLVENLALVALGLFAAVVSAVVAVAPNLASGAAVIPWRSVALTCTGVFGVTMLAGLVALRAAFAKSVLAAIRPE